MHCYLAGCFSLIFCRHYLDVTFSEDESRFLSENAHTTMNALRKFALTVHKNYLAASGKKRSLKANMLAALIRTENLLDLFAFL